MTTWCINEVTITGPDDAITEVLEFIGDGKNLFNPDLPMPEIFDYVTGSPPCQEDVAATVEACGVPDGYSWECAAWAVTWDNGLSLRTVQPGRLEFITCTSGSPLDPVIATLAQRFPRVHVEHFFNVEDGDCSGTRFYANGELSSAEDGPGQHKCSTCSGWGHPVDMVSLHSCGDLHHTACVRSTAEVLVTCDNPNVLDEIADLLTGADLNRWLPANRTEAMLTCHVGRVPTAAECRGWSWPDSAPFLLPVEVTRAAGGSVLLTHSTLTVDTGGSLIALSEQFPTATFYMSFKHPAHVDGSERSIVTRGQVLLVTEPDLFT